MSLFRRELMARRTRDRRVAEKVRRRLDRGAELRPEDLAGE